MSTPCGTLATKRQMLPPAYLLLALVAMAGLHRAFPWHRVVATYVQGKTPSEALSISGKGLLDALPRLPLERRHRAILAVSTLYKAVGQCWVEEACS